MNLRVFALSAGLTTAGLSLAAEASAPPCCPTETPASPCCADQPPAKAAPSCCEEAKPAAPFSARSLYQLDARWTDDAGQPVSLASWRGRPVVLAMFFASCEYACPVLINDIQRLLAQLPPGEREKTRVVLVSFDTARDTPPVLRALRERMKLDANWSLLTGREADVQELAMLLGVKYKQDARGQFSHSNLFTILNPEGEIAHQHAGLMGDVSIAAQFVGKVGR